MIQILVATFLSLTSESQAASAKLTGTLGVTNKLDNAATFIDLSTGATRTVKVGSLPHEIVLGGGFAYVSNYGSAHIRSTGIKDDPGNTLSIVDLATFKVETMDLGPSRCAPHGLVLSKEGKTLYVTCEGRHEIAVIDTGKKVVSHFLRTNQAGSHMLVLSADETLAYVANFWLGTITVLDLTARKILKQISVGRGCEGIDISDDGQDLYVSRVEDGEVIRIDTKKLDISVRKKAGADHSPIRVTAVSPDHVLVNDVRSGKALLLDAKDLSQVQEFNVGRQPIGLAHSATHAFSAGMADGTITVINLLTRKIDAVLPAGGSPDGIAYMP